MKSTIGVDRRFFLRTLATILATAPTFASRALADGGHSHGKQKTPGGQGAENAPRGHEATEPAHGHEMEMAPHVQERTRTAHGHGSDEPPRGHAKEEATHGHEQDARAHGQEAENQGHAGHNHGKETFEKYGLVRAEKGFKEYNLKLSQYRFTPDTLRVDVGDRVRLNLDSVDATHGFYIDGYGLKTLVPEKENRTVEFVANRPGANRIRCSSTCGPFHPFMIGRLIVGQNSLFWWGLVATMVLPVGVLTALGWKEEVSRES